MIALIGLVLSIYILAGLVFKKPHFPGDLIMMIMIMILSVPLLYKTVQLFHPFHSMTGEAFFVFFPLVTGPLLYLYAKVLVEPDYPLKPLLLLHFLPFVITLGVPFTPLLDLYPAMGIIEERKPPRRLDTIRFDRLPDEWRISDKDSQIEDSPEQRESEAHPRPVFRFHFILFFFSGMIYSLIILKLLQKHKGNIDQYFSFHSSMINMSWLFYVLGVFIAVLLYQAAVLLIAPYFKHFFLSPKESFDIGDTLLIITAGFFSSRQERIFFKFGYLTREKELQTDRKESENSPGKLSENHEYSGVHLKKYKKSSLSEEYKDRILIKIQDYMTAEKPYKNGEFTISDLSLKLDISRNHLSQVINERLHKNFYSFINDLRIHEAIMMMDTLHKGQIQSILDIAFSCGFNSKSSFNQLFKKTTGRTPTGYIRLKNSTAF